MNAPRPGAAPRGSSGAGAGGGGGAESPLVWGVWGVPFVCWSDILGVCLRSSSVKISKNDDFLGAVFLASRGFVVVGGWNVGGKAARRIFEWREYL